MRRNNGHGPASRVVEWPKEEWVKVEGSTPRIVDEALWQRVQEILNDPERTRRRPTHRHYALRGRLKCGICGSAMVGQTLTVSAKPYQYYRCRHVYDKNTNRTCTARYVDGPRLEEAIWALDRTYISMVEHGKQNLTIGAVLRIADALDVPIGELIASQAG